MVQREGIRAGPTAQMAQPQRNMETLFALHCHIRRGDASAGAASLLAAPGCHHLRPPPPHGGCAGRQPAYTLGGSTLSLAGSGFAPTASCRVRVPSLANTTLPEQFSAQPRLCARAVSPQLPCYQHHRGEGLTARQTALAPVRTQRSCAQQGLSAEQLWPTVRQGWQ